MRHKSRPGFIVKAKSLSASHLETGRSVPATVQLGLKARQCRRYFQSGSSRERDPRGRDRGGRRGCVRVLYGPLLHSNPFFTPNLSHSNPFLSAFLSTESILHDFYPLSLSPIPPLLLSLKRPYRYIGFQWELKFPLSASPFSLLVPSARVFGPEKADAACGALNHSLKRFPGRLRRRASRRPKAGVKVPPEAGITSYAVEHRAGGAVLSVYTRTLALLLTVPGMSFSS